MTVTLWLARRRDQVAGTRWMRALARRPRLGQIVLGGVLVAIGVSNVLFAREQAVGFVERVAQERTLFGARRTVAYVRLGTHLVAVEIPQHVRCAAGDRAEVVISYGGPPGVRYNDLADRPEPCRA